MDGLLPWVAACSVTGRAGKQTAGTKRSLLPTYPVAILFGPKRVPPALSMTPFPAPSYPPTLSTGFTVPPARLLCQWCHPLVS